MYIHFVRIPHRWINSKVRLFMERLFKKKRKKKIILIELKELLKRATIYGSIVRIYIRLHVKKSFVFIS